MRDTLLVGGVGRCQSKEGDPNQDLLGPPGTRISLTHTSQCARSSLAPPGKEQRNSEVILAAQDPVTPIGGVLVLSASEFCSLTRKTG